MAKKKRKRRRPVAPPVHSAPGTAHGPVGPRPAAAPPVRPEGAEPPAAPIEADTPARAPRRAREATRSRAEQRRRRSRRRNYLIGGAVVLALVAAIVVPRILSSRATSDFNELAKAAGCDDGLQETGGSGGGDHLQPGQATEYDTSPPTHGAHAQTTIPAGIYDEPLSDDPNEQANIFRAVHSLEHGAVIVWYDKLPKAQLSELEREYRTEQKVLVIPYPALSGDDHVAVTAWGRMVTCEEASTRVINAFVDRFREARTAPEPKQRV